MSEEIRVGDRFLVEVEVRQAVIDTDEFFVKFGPHRFGYIHEGALADAKRLPRALKVGDRVRRAYGPCASAFGVILAIHANKAWIDLGDQTTVWLLADLTLAEESAS